MPRTLEQQRGIDFEHHIADLLGGKVQPGSGNKFYAKGDVTTNGFGISAKSQLKFSWSEIKRYLNEIVEDVFGTGNIPVLALEQDGDEYIVMRADDFIKAFQDEIKIVSNTSKGIEKREQAKTPLLLR